MTQTVRDEARKGVALTNLANSAIQLDRDQKAIVELDPNHPGFRDMAYRTRRNEIADIALGYEPGTSVPDAPYTEQEHEVWREVWRNLGPAHEAHACRQCLEGSRALDLPRDRLPQLREVSSRLTELSGFRLEPAGGLVEPGVFLSALGDGIFMATQYIRHSSTPLYTPEPDVVHELIGHATSLSHPLLADINRWIGQASKRVTTAEQLERLGRIYWFTVEFGVVNEQGTPKAYGAGLLSSAGELNRLPEVELRPFDLDVIEAQTYDVTQYQPFLYCADSFDQLYDTLRNHLANWPG
jgi:phenylalanine-4-hydroxylase